DLEFLQEQALAADLGERAVEDLVAARGHRHEVDRETRMQGAQSGSDVLGLPQRERTLARGDPQRLHSARTSLRSAGRLRRLTSSEPASPSTLASTRPSGARTRPASFERATRQLRWIRTKSSPNSSSSAFNDSSTSTSPRAWCTTTYLSSASR